MTIVDVRLVRRLAFMFVVFASGWVVLSLVGIQHWTFTGGDAAVLIGLTGGSLIAHLMAVKKNG